MTPKELRDLAAERREKLGNKETRLSKALDDAADEIERLNRLLVGVQQADVDGRTRLASGSADYQQGRRDGRQIEREALSQPWAFDRDSLGRLVRLAWMRWAQTQDAPKPSWLLPYDELSDADKEADRQIGEAVVDHMKRHVRAAALPAQSGSVQCREDVARAISENDEDATPWEDVLPYWRAVFLRQADAVLAPSKPAGQPADKDKLIEKLHVIAKNVSHALMSFTPGGSEYFTRVQVGDFEGYYADADVCQRRVRERIDGAEARARRALSASRQIETAQRELVEMCRRHCANGARPSAAEAMQLVEIIDRLLAAKTAGQSVEGEKL